MKYIIALLIAILLIIGMFAFQAWMSQQMSAWENANATLSSFEKTLARVSFVINRYSYLFVILIVAACGTVAVLIPKRVSDGSPDK